MKRLLFLILPILITFNSYSIPVKTPPLAVASIDTNYRITIPSIPIQRYYYVDISHLDFADEQEAIYLLTSYVTANLISNEVFYSEGYMQIQLHLEHIPESDRTVAKMQNYLNCLTKPH